MSNLVISHLDELESESIFVIRELVSEFENPVLLFSGGKDSIVVLHLAIKAFWPAKLPFPLMHIDTGHNFDETITFRDALIEKFNLDLKVGYVQESIDDGSVKEETGKNASRNGLQTTTLLSSIEAYNFDAAIGGARRDEEKARAKERFFSHRDDFGQWNPKNQRPELWNLFNGKKNKGEHFRVFPISNWTELDVWQYIEREKLDIPGLYLAHEREVINRDGVLLAKSNVVMPEEGEKVEVKQVRFRTIGDMTCTGAVESDADSIEKVIEEIISTRQTERGGRADDKRSQAAMEDRKKQGYF